MVVLYNTIEIDFTDLDSLEAQASHHDPELDTVQLMTVSCGKPNYQGIRDIRKPLDQSITMLKSAVLFTQKPISIHIFTESDMAPLFRTELDSWPQSVKKRMKYTIHDAKYDGVPEELKNTWKGWYKPCGSFRLLTPEILPKHNVNACIYADSDVVWTKPIDQLWDQLKDFENKEVMAVSPTAGHNLGGSSLNENFILHKSGLFQINTGVMLMNFTRMNSAEWLLSYNEKIKERPAEPVKYGSDLLIPYYNRYKDKAEHDQKLMNIIFHFNPDLLRQLKCQWNFKTNFCVDDDNVCESAELDGPGAVHGTASGFFGTEHPVFKALYETIKAYNWNRDVCAEIQGVFDAHVQRSAGHSYCGQKAHIISDQLGRSCKIARL